MARAGTRAKASAAASGVAQSPWRYTLALCPLPTQGMSLYIRNVEKDLSPALKERADLASI